MFHTLKILIFHQGCLTQPWKKKKKKKKEWPSEGGTIAGDPVVFVMAQVFWALHWESIVLSAQPIAAC